MTELFDQLPDRKSTESAKWHYYGPDVLPMWVADMDFRSPEPVIRALQERVAHGVFGYADTPEDLKPAVIDWIYDHYGWQVEPGALVFLTGVVTGTNLAGQAFASPGPECATSAILIQTPVYMPFLTLARNASAELQTMQLTHHPDGFYSIDWDAFENAITPDTRLFVLCNPHNPVGRVFTREELERMAEICLRHNVIMCSDEIHCDLIYNSHKHVPLASLSPEIARRTVTLMAPSKTFNIAGLACSVAIITDPELRNKFCIAHRGLTHGVNLLGLIAAQAAYRHGQDWLDQLLVYLEGNRDWMVKFVNEQLPGVSMFCPEGTYLAWLDCRQAGIDGSPFKFFLNQAKVALVEGKAFGQGGEGFVRFNFGCPRSMLEEALYRMQAALLENR